MNSHLQKAIPILIDRDGGVTSITFNRPERMNTIDVSMAQSLAQIADDLVRDDLARVVLLRGAGSCFMAGGDIRMMREDPSHIDEVIQDFHKFVLALRRLPIPVLAVVHGSAAGAGFSLAIGCDFVIASESTKFTLAYPLLGTSPDGGSSFFLTKLLGHRRATELMLLNEPMTARRALDLGLINWVTPDERLEQDIERIVHSLIANAPKAVAATKHLLNHSDNVILERQLEEERRLLLDCTSTADFAEGIDAFLQKRRPQFTGR